MTKDEMMKTVLWYCVDILNAVSSWFGVTYEELNILSADLPTLLANVLPSRA